MDNTYTISLNRFQRLSLWCQDCNHYWQIANHLVNLHGTVDRDLLQRLLKINLFLYKNLLDINVEEFFGKNYIFEIELNSVFNDVRDKLKNQSKEIKILDVDIMSNIETKMPQIIDLVIQLKSSFDLMSNKILENSSRKFITKLGILKKNILKSFENDNIKCALDNLMDLNIAGFDLLVQCAGIIFNCFYILNIEICEPIQKTPGVTYCEDHAIIIERLANISAQNFLYKHNRRWLAYYRDILTDCKSLFKNNEKRYNELRSCGNFQTIENEIFNLLVFENPEVYEELTIFKYIDRFPKTAKEIYEWWSGRSKEQLQKIYKSVHYIDMDKASTMFPFILSRNLHVKDRIYYDILNILKMFSHINPSLENSIGFILRIYPEVFEQIYFPDRERYIKLSCNPTIGKKEDIFDNINNKNSLRKCEDLKCQERNKGKNVVWNLNTFEIEKHSMNTIFKELLKNPQILEDISAYVNKNFDLSINPNLLKKTKYVH